MRMKTAPVDAERKDVPTAKLVKRAERKTAGCPSEERRRRAHARLERGSPFTRDDA
ncbi:hypothetical protein GCM10027062_35850 [Nocardioides hungaricus]